MKIEHNEHNNTVHVVFELLVPSAIHVYRNTLSCLCTIYMYMYFSLKKGEMFVKTEL